MSGSAAMSAGRSAVQRELADERAVRHADQAHGAGLPDEGGLLLDDAHPHRVRQDRLDRGARDGRQPRQLGGHGRGVDGQQGGAVEGCERALQLGRRRVPLPRPRHASDAQPRPVDERQQAADEDRGQQAGGDAAGRRQGAPDPPAERRAGAAGMGRRAPPRIRSRDASSVRRRFAVARRAPLASGLQPKLDQPRDQIREGQAGQLGLLRDTCWWP